MATENTCCVLFILRIFKRKIKTRVWKHLFNTVVNFHIQLFRERLSEKQCTRQSRKVIWDMINTLVPDTVAVEPTFVAFL